MADESGPDSTEHCVRIEELLLKAAELKAQRLIPPCENFARQTEAMLDFGGAPFAPGPGNWKRRIEQQRAVILREARDNPVAGVSQMSLLNYLEPVNNTQELLVLEKIKDWATSPFDYLSGSGWVDEIDKATGKYVRTKSKCKFSPYMIIGMRIVRRYGTECPTWLVEAAITYAELASQGRIEAPDAGYTNESLADRVNENVQIGLLYRFAERVLGNRGFKRKLQDFLNHCFEPSDDNLPADFLLHWRRSVHGSCAPIVDLVPRDRINGGFNESTKVGFFLDDVCSLGENDATASWYSKHPEFSVFKVPTREFVAFALEKGWRFRQ